MNSFRKAWNHISDEGAKAIGESLAINFTLERLSISIKNMQNLKKEELQLEISVQQLLEKH